MSFAFCRDRWVAYKEWHNFSPCFANAMNEGEVSSLIDRRKFLGYFKGVDDEHVSDSDAQKSMAAAILASAPIKKILCTETEEKRSRRDYSISTASTSSSRALSKFQDARLGVLERVMDCCTLSPHSRILDIGSSRGLAAIFFAAVLGCGVAGIECVEDRFTVSQRLRDRIDAKILEYCGSEEKCGYVSAEHAQLTPNISVRYLQPVKDLLRNHFRGLSSSSSKRLSIQNRTYFHRGDACRDDDEFYIECLKHCNVVWFNNFSMTFKDDNINLADGSSMQMEERLKDLFADYLKSGAIIICLEALVMHGKRNRTNSKFLKRLVDDNGIPHSAVEIPPRFATTSENYNYPKIYIYVMDGCKEPRAKKVLRDIMERVRKVLDDDRMYNELCGKRIRVWWEAERKFFEGVVVANLQAGKFFRIKYDDNECREHKLTSYWVKRSRKQVKVVNGHHCEEIKSLEVANSIWYFEAINS